MSRIAALFVGVRVKATTRRRVAALGHAQSSRRRADGAEWRHFKGIFCDDIREFESSRPASQSRLSKLTCEPRSKPPGTAAFRRNSFVFVCGTWAAESVIPALVSGDHFWCLVFDGALKALGWFSRETRRYSCVSL
jgi:hypothetical protein